MVSANGAAKIQMVKSTLKNSKQTEMENFKSIDEILDFAINSEQEAVDFYSELANSTKDEAMKLVYMDFVAEEMSHKARLLKIKEEGVFTVSSTEIPDLKISDYLVPITARFDMNYAEALVVVMKKEKAAFKLYGHLASIAPTPELKQVFKMLAMEEAGHKLKFEQEYDEFVLKEN